VIEPPAFFPSEGDATQQILRRLFDALLPPRNDTPDHLTQVARASGLEKVEVVTTADTFEECPADVISSIRARDGSAFWDLSDEVWDRVVEPRLAELAALPGGERPRQRHRLVHHLVLRVS
jgi:hypothetical protein